jgi:hypothetical protein
MKSWTAFIPETAILPLKRYLQSKGARCEKESEWEYFRVDDSLQLFEVS